MADIIQPCDCIPYENLNCCGSINGISVMQPKCQSTPDGQVVNNPCFDSENGKSYWSYKILTDCTQDTRGISNILIPICSSIPRENIVVSEKIDGCGTFNSIDFELIMDDPNFGLAPEGFQWLKIETNDRFDKGISVEYRLEIDGNFPVSTLPINIKASTALLTFDCNDGFLVPACNPQGTLNITKNCNYTIVNNEATLIYSIAVSNIGNATLNDVQFKDNIIIPSILTLGKISVNPSSLEVNTLVPGEIIISGNLGNIDPSQVVKIDYTIPITAIEIPGVYIISNNAKASASETEATATCSTALNAVQLNTNNCCQLTDSNVGEFQITLSSIGQSPDTVVKIVDNIFIPGGVTLRFNSFDGCIATFANTDEIVPINTDLVGPLRISVTCNDLAIPSSGLIRKSIKFTVVSTSVFRQIAIQNSIESVTPTFPDRQIFLGAGSFPIEADVTVEASLGCTKPCSFDL